MSLEVRDLAIEIGGRRVVDGVSFDVPDGARIGLIGESGSGKSMTAMAILGLLPEGAVASGSVRWAGRELLGLPDRELATLRGDEIGIVFQEPRTALNPIRTIGRQIAESARIHEKLGRRAAQERAVQEAERVFLPDPRRIVRRYPHELSGGQRQRVGIARALAAEPDLIVLDEPIASLDVSVQAQVMNLLMRLQRELGLTYVFIAHDLAAVQHVSDDVAVMYRGHIVEQGPAARIYADPQHDYTKALLSAVPIPDPPRERTRRRITYTPS
jgi:peptide/nickel transport system ATP-binding protein